MNVKLRVLSAGVLFFMGGQTLLAQTKQDTIPKQETKIDEVVVVGYRAVSKKTAVVSTAQIKEETINGRPNSNLMNVVQGQLAGVNISTGTGQPGAKPTVIIRGVGTFSGNTDPLYVIDGFPTNSDSFRSLNPNDVESMEVLKDASATAQYGNRGSNGVIVIKTKQGRYGDRTAFNYRSQIGVSMLQDARYNLANARELLTLENRYGAGVGADMTQEEINNYQTNTNWLDVFFRPSFLQSHDFSVTTGAKNINSYTNVGYLQQDGILENSGMKRFTVRNTINGKTNDNKFKYTFGTAIGFTRNDQIGSLGTGGVNQNMVLGAYQGAPHLSPSLYQNSQQLFNLYETEGTLLYTPLFLIDKMKTFYTGLDEMRLDVTSELSYQILPSLTARMRANAQLITQNGLTWQHPISFNSFLFQNGTEAVGTETIAESRQFYFNNLWQLEYSKSFGDHTINAAGAFEFNNAMLKSSTFTQRGLNPLTWVPGAGTGYVTDTSNDDFNVPTVGAGQSRLNMFSFFGNLDYDYNKKYGIVANIRRDASSRFSEDQRWGTFWSVGGRWNVDEESFMDNVKWVNSFKIRGSYGVTGNQRIVDGTVWAGLNPPPYLDTFSIVNNVYNGLMGMGITLGYADLRWETTKQWNIGTDFELFNRKLRGQFDVYDRKTIDLFDDWAQSPTSGVLSIRQNTPQDLRNSGYELSLAYDLIKNGNLTFTLRGNGSINKQRVYDLPDGILREGTQPMVYSQNGSLYQAPYVYHYLGVNPSNGNLLFEDINGNPTETPTTADLRPLKYNTVPKYQGGFGFDLDYKGLYLSTTFTYVAGLYRYDYDMSGFYDPTQLGQFNVSSDLLNAWTPTNTNTNIPSLTASNYDAQALSDRFLVDASYVRLRNIQLGYNIPKSLLNGTFVRELRITLQGENLATWTKWQGYDAESNRGADQSQYPSPKTFTLGFDVKF